MSEYNRFALYYDSLTDNVDYKARAAFYHSLIQKHAPYAHLLLDLACGTGSLCAQMSSFGYDLIGVDASQDMLSVAVQKTESFTGPVLFLCQKAEKLDLYGTIDACVCSLDSLNHLDGSQALECALNRVSLFLNPGGIFLFDVNTLYKHKEILADNMFVVERGDVFCVWRNCYLEKDNSVEITLDFFEKTGGINYKRYSESFTEYYYDDILIRKILEKNGMKIVDCYDGDDFGPVTETTQRLLYAARKKEKE